jgi:serine/threonine protein kinase
MPDGNVKGIDLESAMPQGGNPVDYSPEACPPEFAKSFLEGDARFFTLHYSYDIWSLGMLFLELATGRGVFDNKTPAETTKLLKDLDEIPLNNMEGCGDDNLRDLIQNCLQKNDRSRPSMAQVMKHPYFVNIPKPNAHYFMN